MTKMSINFDNEEQYKNFVQSIKDEVLKDLPEGRRTQRFPSAHIWNYAKDKIDDLELLPHEVVKLRAALSTILQYGFKTRTVHQFPDEHYEEVKPLIDELFNSMNAVRKYKRTEPAYEDHWKTKEEIK